VFLFLSGRRDGAFRVIPVTSDSGLLVSRSLRLALNSPSQFNGIANHSNSESLFKQMIQLSIFCNTLFEVLDDE